MENEESLLQDTVKSFVEAVSFLMTSFKNRIIVETDRITWSLSMLEFIKKKLNCANKF